jgi:hypothetical protein
MQCCVHATAPLAWVAFTEDAEKSTNSWFRLPPRLLRLACVSKYLLKSIWATYSSMSAARVFALSRLLPSGNAAQQPGQRFTRDCCEHDHGNRTLTLQGRPAAALNRLSLMLFGGPCILSKTKRRSA